MMCRKWIFFPLLLLTLSSYSPASAIESLLIHGKIIAVHPGESIQQAIDQAERGSIVLVSAGIYYESIKLKQGITLRSEGGAKSTIIDGQNSTKPVVRGANACIIEGFTITGCGASGKESSPSHAVECINVSPVIKNNIIKNNYGTGVYVKGKGAAPTIVDNIIYSNQGAGIGNEHRSQAKITGNECYANARAGIGIRHQASPVLENNHCHHNQMAGIGIKDQATSPILKNNHSYFNRFSGVGVEDGASPTLEANQLYSNGRAGVGIRYASKVTLRGNIIRGNTLSGIGVMKDCQVIVKQNTLAQNTMAGITVTDGSEADITHNTIRDNGTQGVVCSFSKVNVQHNTISDNSHHGVAIYRRSQAQITENTIINNGAHDRRGTGVIVVLSNDVVISDNTFEENYGPGVYAHKSSPKIEHNKFANDLVFIKEYSSPMVANNTFYSGGRAGGKKYKSGVDIREYASPIIMDNQFYGHFGVAVRAKSRPLIVNNSFSGQHKASVKSGRSGIKVDKDSYPVIKQNIFYNGNKVMVGGKSVNTNITLFQMRARFRPRKKGKIPEALKKAMLIIADNLFIN